MTQQPLTPSSPQPVLFTFRRCPYAMRARLALAVAEQAYLPFEVVLRNKPAALLQASPKGTVPVLVLPSGQVIEESLQIMLWALHRHDPQAWLSPTEGQLEDLLQAITSLDQHFKPLLDRCKYPERYPETTQDQSRAHALEWLAQWEARLQQAPFLFGARISLADAAFWPFVRQFAAIDLLWWDAQPLPYLQQWRHQWLALPLFESVMQKPTVPASA